MSLTYEELMAKHQRTVPMFPKETHIRPYTRVLIAELIYKHDIPVTAWGDLLRMFDEVADEAFWDGDK